MRLNKATHYGLFAALEMARIENGEVVTVAEVAGRYELPEGVLAKVFQQLARAGIAVGTRGVGGGYRLARAPSDLTVLDVIDALETGDGKLFSRPESAGDDIPSRRPGLGNENPGTAGSDPDRLPSPARGLERLFREVDDLSRATFASTSLETLARG
jgi:Rrf2 family protein